MTDEARHGKQTIVNGLHSAISYEYADEAARLAATGFDNGDLYKFAYQLSTSEIYILTNTLPTWSLVTGGGVGASLSKIAVNFVLQEDINNSQEWFYAFRGNGNTQLAGARSGSNAALQNAASASPFIVPFNGTIIGATCVLRGAGVQNGSVTYPVQLTTRLQECGFTAMSTISDINFSISNLFTVGTFSPASTNFTQTITPSIAVTEGQAISLKFINGTGASDVGQIRNLFVTIVIEES